MSSGALSNMSERTLTANAAQNDEPLSDAAPPVKSVKKRCSLWRSTLCIKSILKSKGTEWNTSEAWRCSAKEITALRTRRRTMALMPPLSDFLPRHPAPPPPRAPLANPECFSVESSKAPLASRVQLWCFYWNERSEGGSQRSAASESGKRVGRPAGSSCGSPAVYGVRCSIALRVSV